ncbi:MAG: type II toxin-antitoxin system HigB family toxin [Saprospiraceae bacterium]
MFNIIARKSLLEYCKKYPFAANALLEWYHEFEIAEFSSFQNLKSVYKSVSIVGDNRVVFNILGNQYRLVIRILFDFKAIQIKWFGTHDEYNKIDVKKIHFKKRKKT